MKIIVTAGGTMGHINPALAIIDEFKKMEKNLEVIYVGTHNRMEKNLIPKLGIDYVPLTIYGFTKNIFLDIKNIFCIKAALKKCRKLMLDFKPDVVIGVGGYVTYPVIKAAKEMNIKTFIHEQNSIPGKSNKMIAKYADLIGITFVKSKDYFETNGKIIYTGQPCGAKAISIPKKNKKDLGLTNGKKLVTFVAGSLGSDSLNHKVKNYLLSIADKDYEVCYITGKMHYENFIKNTNFPKNVKVVPFVEELPGLLKISDIVVSRAGAGSLSEILALEVPSIIIPSPNVANNHQYYNAKEYFQKGYVLMLEEKDITSKKLEESIEDLLEDTRKRVHMKTLMQEEATCNSAKIIYQEIKKLIENK